MASSRVMPGAAPAPASSRVGGVPWLAVVAIGLVLTTAVVVRLQQPSLTEPFDTDEADYAGALTYGFTANYLGLAERSGWEFAASTGREFIRTGRARPFRHDWAAGDAAALRHYHPPVALYPAAAMLSHGERREHVLRWIPLITAVLGCLASAWLAWVLASGLARQVRWIVGLLAAAFIALSPWHVSSSVTLSFHQGYWLASALTLGFATIAWRTGSARAWYVMASLLGVAIATVPYWLLLVPVALGVLRWAPWRPMTSKVRLGVVGTALTALALTVVWPPALVRGDLVKPAMLYAWIVVEPLAAESRAGAWLLALVRAHWWVLLLPVLAAFWARRSARTAIRGALPAFAFVLLFVLLNSRVHHMKPLYGAAVLPAAAALAALACGLILERWSGRGLLPAAAAGAALVLGVALVKGPAPGRDDWRPAMSALAGRVSSRTVLVAPRPAAGTFRYYLDRARIVPDAAEAADEADIRAMLADGRITEVLSLPVADRRVQSLLPDCYDRQPNVKVASMNVRHWRRGARECVPR